MNTGRYMLLYNDKNHWNYNLRDEFFQKVFDGLINVDDEHVGQELLRIQ